MEHTSKACVFLSQRVTQLEREKTAIEEQVEDRLATLTQDLVESQDRNRSLSKELAESRKKLDNDEQYIQLLEEQYEKCQREKGDLESRVRSARQHGTVSALTSNKTNGRSSAPTRDDLLDEVRDARSRARGLEEDNVRLSEEKDKLQEAVAHAENKIEQLQELIRESRRNDGTHQAPREETRGRDPSAHGALPALEPSSTFDERSPAEGLAQPSTSVPSSFARRPSVDPLPRDTDSVHRRAERPGGATAALSGEDRRQPRGDVSLSNAADVDPRLQDFRQQLEDVAHNSYVLATGLNCPAAAPEELPANPAPAHVPDVQSQQTRPPTRPPRVSPQAQPPRVPGRPLHSTPPGGRGTAVGPHAIEQALTAGQGLVETEEPPPRAVSPAARATHQKAPRPFAGFRRPLEHRSPLNESLDVAPQRAPAPRTVDAAAEPSSRPSRGGRRHDSSAGDLHGRFSWIVEGDEASFEVTGEHRVSSPRLKIICQALLEELRDRHDVVVESGDKPGGRRL